jgi:putative ABC transport system permease protein
MNVMLVSVTERTREIGICMAVGATEAEVRFQFLAESVLLSLVGGAIGVLLGVIGSLGLGRSLDWPMQISALQLQLASSSGTTRHARRRCWIEALRFE